MDPIEETVALLGALESEAKRMGYPFADQLSRLTTVLCERIDELEAEKEGHLLLPRSDISEEAVVRANGVCRHVFRVSHNWRDQCPTTGP